MVSLYTPLNRQSLPAGYDQCALDSASKETAQREFIVKKLTPILRNYVDALRVLHSEGKIHGDIRPKNLAVYEGTGRLIDWETTQDIESWELSHAVSVAMLFGKKYYDIFAPFQCSKGEKWDLYALGYAMMHLDATQTERESFGNPETRTDFLTALLNASNRRIATFGARIIRALDNMVTVDYDALLQILQ